MFYIMAIKIDPRTEVAPKVQQILTECGGIIKTRLGLHEQKDQSGLILLNLVNEKKDIGILLSKLNELHGVCAKLLEI